MNDLYLNLQQAASDLIKVKEALINEGVEISDDTEVTTYADKITSLYSDDVETMRLAWWDVVTGKNTKPTYDNMFRYMDFDLIGGFNPPYTIKPTYCGGCFSYANIKKITPEQLDFSSCVSANYGFSNCRAIEEIGRLHIPSGHGYLFAECYALEKLGPLVLKKGLKLNVDGPPFVNCPKLREISFEGTIINSVSFRTSPLLSAESVENIISVLSTAEDITGQTITFNSKVKETYYNAHSSEYADADTAWNALVSTRPNWRITLV